MEGRPSQRPRPRCSRQTLPPCALLRRVRTQSLSPRVPPPPSPGGRLPAPLTRPREEVLAADPARSTVPSSPHRGGPHAPRSDPGPGPPLPRGPGVLRPLSAPHPQARGSGPSRGPLPLDLLGLSRSPLPSDPLSDPIRPAVPASLGGLPPPRGPSLTPVPAPRANSPQTRRPAPSRVPSFQTRGPAPSRGPLFSDPLFRTFAGYPSDSRSLSRLGSPLSPSRGLFSTVRTVRPAPELPSLGSSPTSSRPGSPRRGSRCHSPAPRVRSPQTCCHHPARRRRRRFLSHTCSPVAPLPPVPRRAPESRR